MCIPQVLVAWHKRKTNACKHHDVLYVHLQARFLIRDRLKLIFFFNWDDGMESFFSKISYTTTY